MVRDYCFKDYDLNFISGEHWDTHPEKNLFIGFELEVEFPLSNVGEMNDIADYIEGAYDEILCCKWDSSLNNGFEFISHPIHVELYENGYMESVLTKLMNDLSNEPKGNIYNNFNVSQLVVREEADIKKIAEELYTLQRREQRKRGVPNV